MLICARSGIAGVDYGGEYGYEPSSTEDPSEAPPEPQMPLEPGLADKVARITTNSFGLLPPGTEITIDFEPAHQFKPESLLGGELRPMVGADMQLQMQAELDRLEPSLARYIKFAAIGRVAFSVGLGARTAALELDGRRLTGVQVEYEVRMPEEDYRRGRMPQPFKPEDMPAGSEIVLEAGAYEGSALEATFRAIAMEDDYGEWRGLAIAVEKIGPQRVRILTGPTEGVRENLFIGLKLGKHFKLGLGNQTTLKQYRLRTAEIQLDTEEGRRTYNQIWLTGRLGEGRLATERTGTVSKIIFQSQTSVRVKAGPVGVGREIASNEGTRRDTRYFDSDERNQEIAIRYGNSAAIIDSDYAGQELNRRKIDIVYRNIDGTLAYYLEQAFTREGRPLSGRWDVHITLDEAQAMGIQGMAAAFLAKQRLPGGSPYLAMLAEADDGSGVAVALARAWSVGHLVEALLGLSFDAGSPLPGAIALSSRTEADKARKKIEGEIKRQRQKEAKAQRGR